MQDGGVRLIKNGIACSFYPFRKIQFFIIQEVAFVQQAQFFQNAFSDHHTCAMGIRGFRYLVKLTLILFLIPVMKTPRGYRVYWRCPGILYGIVLIEIQNFRTHDSYIFVQIPSSPPYCLKNQVSPQYRCSTTKYSPLWPALRQYYYRPQNPNFSHLR